MSFRKAYLDALGQTDPDKLTEVRRVAHEIRRFEIELYWKRATYFWAFQLVAFAALSLIFKDGGLKSPALLPVPAAIGVITAVAGILTARGSKFWQENWEAHVDMLEEETGERLTQVVMCRRSPQYSVSRVNEFLLRVFALGWTAVLVLSAFPQAIDIYRLYLKPTLGLLILTGTALTCVGMWRFTKTEFSGDMFQLGGKTWTPYPSGRKITRPFILRRDPLSTRSMRRLPNHSRDMEQ